MVFCSTDFGSLTAWGGIIENSFNFVFLLVSVTLIIVENEKENFCSHSNRSIRLRFISILLGDLPFGDPTDQQVELIAGEDGTVTLSITDLSVMNGAFTFDQISLEGCPATENEDGSISVSTEGTVTLTFENVGNCDIDMTGSIKDGEAVLDLNIAPEMLDGTTVTAHFEGTRSETAAE